MTEQDIYDSILQTNLAYFGIDSSKQLPQKSLSAASKVAEFLSSKGQTEVCIVINDNYSAKYALAIALGLNSLKFATNIICLCRLSKIKDQTAQNLITEITSLSAKYLKVWQDFQSADIVKAGAFLLALGDSKALPSLRERETIKRITHFNPVKINLEYPIKGFSWDLSISFDYAKTEDAAVFKSGINTNLVAVGPGELAAVVLPNQKTHLNQNCKLTLITSSPELYIQDKLKLWSMDIVSPQADLNVLIEKLRSAETIMIDLDNLYADLLLETVQKLIPKYVLIEIQDADRKVVVLKSSTDTSTFKAGLFKLVLSDGVITLSGNEIYTNLPKQAKFNSPKTIQELGVDCAALLKYNHAWIAVIGSCVW